MEPSRIPISLLVIGATVLASFAGFSSRRAILDYAECPWEILHDGKWHQLLTSGFLHADLGHLFMNMFTLFFFGPPIEQALGGRGFLVLYLGSLLSGSLLTLALYRNDKTYRSVGASGAVSGIVFAFVLFRPLAPIYIFLIPIGIPAVVFALGYVAISLFGARRRLGRIGHAAHLGGALGGVLLTIILYPRVVSIFLSHFR